MSLRVVVIGGGISGLSAAHQLARDGAAVTLLEAAGQLGGLGTFFRYGDRWIERFYHCIMPSDAHLRHLIDEVGLSEQLRWRPTRMTFIHRRRRYPFNSPWDLLRFGPLTFLQRLRLGALTLLLRRLGKGVDLDNMSTEKWLSGIFGKAVWGRFWEPLFRAKFGDRAAQLPALYIWQRLGRERNNSTRGSLTGGYQGLFEALERSISQNGGVVRTAAPVRQVRESARTDRGMEVELESGERLTADWVICTVPLPLLNQMTEGTSLRQSYRDPQLPYQGVVNALFFLDRPLDGAYCVPVVDSETGFDGIVEMSALVDRERYGGRHLVYLMKYGDRESDLFRRDDASISQQWSQELISLYPDLPLKRAHIVDSRVFRAPFVEPMYPVGYGSMKPGFACGDSHLVLATTAQVYPDITAFNFSVRLARQAVAHIYGRMAVGVPPRGALATPTQ